MTRTEPVAGAFMCRANKTHASTEETMFFPTSHIECAEVENDVITLQMTSYARHHKHSISMFKDNVWDVLKELPALHSITHPTI